MQRTELSASDEKLHHLSGLVAGDSAICGRLAALILRLRPAGLRFEEFRSLVKRGGFLSVPKTLRFQNRENAAICNRRRKKTLRFFLTEDLGT